MPKLIFKLDRFEKGIVSVHEARDLPPGTLVDARSCDLSTVGVIRLVSAAKTLDIFGTLGYAGQKDNTNELDDYKIEPGWGYFYFAHDYTRPVVSSAPAPDLSEFYVIPYGPKFHIYATNEIAGAGMWDAQNDSGARDLLVANYSIELGADSGTDAIVHPVFYYGDGAIRVCDANYSASADNIAFRNRWFGHIKR